VSTTSNSQIATHFRILVVCTGNICRSPMGERILRHELAQVLVQGASAIEVTSAGTYAGHAGEPMQPGAAAVMSERGIAYDDFRASALTEALIESHDLILTAERSHRADVVRLNPVAVHRTFTVLEFGRLVESSAAGSSAPTAGLADGRFTPATMGGIVARAAGSRGVVPPPDHARDDDVADPYSLPVEEFRRCAARLDDAFAPLLAALRPRG